MGFKSKLHKGLPDAPGQHGASLYKSGGCLMTPATILTGTRLGIQARLTVSPLYVPIRGKISGICCHVTNVGTAGAVLRVGLYADNGNGSAEKLLFDFGEPPFSTLIDTTNIGFQAFNLPAAVRPTIPAGLYWIAVCPQGAPATQATFTALDGIIPIAPTGWMLPTDSSFVGYRKEGADDTTGALPDRTGNPFFFGTGGSIPRIGILGI
jgi:hypothetical protein